MAVAATRALGRCRVCRHSVLETFASLAGVRLGSQTAARRPSCLLAKTSPARIRPFHSSRGVWQQQEQQQKEQNDAVSETGPEAGPEAATTTTTTTSTAVPWYLQVETPSPPPSASNIPLLSNYEIPPLPTNPPPILHPLLEHLSTSIGLSDLTILDLRSIWPPPALGANLLMIIGTARSTKHLNVSADRLCRWLRSSEHNKGLKLRPFADGLLGRQELKLKLRRRARKMKMAQAVGRTHEVAASAADDITTGWICVNVGAVPAVPVEAEPGQVESAAVAAPAAAPAESETVDQSREIDEQIDADEDEDENEDETEIIDDYAGFGPTTPTARIVVQIFTEEKRAEMDLEGLWDFRSHRRSKQAEKGDYIAAVQERQWREKLDESLDEKDQHHQRESAVY